MQCTRCGHEFPEPEIIGPIRCQCGAWIRSCLYGTEPMPRWAMAVAGWRRVGDRGVGDTFQRLTHSVGLAMVPRLLAWFGVNCGCDQRQDEWNARWPYED